MVIVRVSGGDLVRRLDLTRSATLIPVLMYVRSRWGLCQQCLLRSKRGLPYVVVDVGSMSGRHATPFCLDSKHARRRDNEIFVTK